jgi:hypothetical protein
VGDPVGDEDGTEAGSAAGPARTGHELATERAHAAHWREVAGRRQEALAELRRRPSVRALLAFDRLTLPARRRLRRARTRVAATARRVPLAVAALPRRPWMRARHRRLEAAAGPPPDPSTRAVSAVLVAVPGGERTSPPPTAGVDCRWIAVDAGGTGAPAAIGRALAAADTDLVAVVLASTDPLDAGWLARLAAALGPRSAGGAPVVAAAPVTVHPARAAGRATPHDLAVRSAGLRLASDAGTPVVAAVGAGSAPRRGRPAEQVDAAGAACLVVDRQALVRAGGWPDVGDPDAAAVVLCARLAAGGGRVVVVPEVVAFDTRPVASWAELRTPLPAGGAPWHEAVDRAGPLLRHAAHRGEPEPLSFAITVAAPSPKVAPRWGDWHLGAGLAGSLERSGHEVRLQTADRRDDPAGRSCDVHVVLRGLQPVRRTTGQRHVLWVISHPEAVAVEECDEADLVLVASERFAEHLRGRTATPVEVMLQATDHRRFRPASGPVRHPVVVVAKTRDVLRPVVADALAAGLRPAIHGSGWHGLVDPELVVADHVPNEQLPAVYATAGLVLNDHWGTMRAWGFVSNRIFDVLACGTPVISDRVPGIDELFAGTVPTYTSPEELRALVAEVEADPDAARARARRGRDIVLGAHTFDHRAAELLAHLATLGDDEAAPGG